MLVPVRVSNTNLMHAPLKKPICGNFMRWKENMDRGRGLTSHGKGRRGLIDEVKYAERKDVCLLMVTANGGRL